MPLLKSPDEVHTLGKGAGDGTDGSSDGNHGTPSEDFVFDFEDVPLLIPTPEVEEHIAQYLPLRQMFALPQQPATGWLSPVDSMWPLTPELNVLYWPTGATRWGFGAFLFSGEDLDKVIDAVQTAASGGGTYLNIGDGQDQDHSISVKMRPLCPLPVAITEPDEDGVYDLYVLPLVDARCLGQNGRSVGSGYPTNTGLPSDWVGITTPSNYAQLNLNQVVGSNVSIPSLDWHFRYVERSPLFDFGVKQHASAAQVGEAMLWSTGLTLISELDGSAHTCLDNDTSAGRLSDLIGLVDDGTFDVVAGYLHGSDGHSVADRLIDSGIPSAFELTIIGPVSGDSSSVTGSSRFPAYRGVPTDIESTGTFKTSANEVSEANGAQLISWHVFSPIIVPLDDPEDPDSGVEQGYDDCRAISRDIATAWFAQVANPIDVTLAGICRVPLSSHTDLVEFTFNRRGPQTRIRSRRWNAFPNRLVNQLRSRKDSSTGPDGVLPLTEFGSGGSENDPNNDGAIGEGTITVNGDSKPAFYPTKTRGYAEFDGNAVIWGFDYTNEKYYILHHRPLDFDAIYEEVKHRLVDNGDIGGDAAAGGDVAGGAL